MVIMPCRKTKKIYKDRPKCLCLSRPECSYPHVYSLGVEQWSDKPEDPNSVENKNFYEVPLTKLKPIDPKSYFLTTGDLTSKLKILEKDAFNLAFSVRKLINLAKKTQGKSQFLETTIDGDGKVCCQAKTTKVERARRAGKTLPPKKPLRS